MKPNRGPAFQYYPDKYRSGTSHLSDSADRAYRRVMDWMWLNSPKGYTMPDTTDAWETATGFKGGKLDKCRKEIMKPHWKLLRKRHGTLTSNGLRKEYEKQKEWREKSSEGGKKSARARARKRLGLDGKGKGGSTTVPTTDQPTGNTPSPSPSPSPPVSPTASATETPPPTEGKSGSSRKTPQQRRQQKRETQEQRRQRMIEELHEHEKIKHRGSSDPSQGSSVPAGSDDAEENETAPEIDVTPEADTLGGGLV